jgi:hypothetical protein
MERAAKLKAKLPRWQVLMHRGHGKVSQPGIIAARFPRTPFRYLALSKNAGCMLRFIFQLSGDFPIPEVGFHPGVTN